MAVKGDKIAQGMKDAIAETASKPLKKQPLAGDCG